MDLDKLIASLQASAGISAAAPLISTDTFVPSASENPAADKDAACRMLAAFAYWLVRYGHIAPEAAPERRAFLTKITAEPEHLTKHMEALGESLIASDVQAEWKDFALAYLAPVEGGLGDDYFKLFVEAPGRRSLRDALPTPSDYEQFALMIESRAKRFQQGAADWNKPLELANAPQPSLWKGGSKDEWLQRLATYEDLLDSLPKLLRARVAEYWSLVDAAPTMADPDIASALVKTYLWVDDPGIQQAVYRALAGFPPRVAMQGILANIVDLESKTDWSDTVVDVFRDDLAEVELVRLADTIAAAPRDQQVAYLSALRRAERNGSRHAARLLKAIHG